MEGLNGEEVLIERKALYRGWLKGDEDLNES